MVAIDQQGRHRKQLADHPLLKGIALQRNVERRTFALNARSVS